MKGKKMPQVGRVEISIIEEDQARLLAFQNGELDLMNMEGPLAPNVLDGGKLQARVREEGREAVAHRRPRDHLPLLEHAGPGRRRPRPRRRSRCAGRWRWPTTSTRRSRSSATARRSRRSTRSRRASSATSRTGRAAIKYDPAGANALLDKFGYKKGADGYRTLPDGKPLVVRYCSRPDTLGRQQDELWKKAFDAIGVRMEVQKDKFPELLKLEKQCKLQRRTASWIADYPDGDNFMQLLYGPNIVPEQQRLREDPRVRQALRAVAADAAGPARDKLYQRDDADHRGLRAVAPRHQPLPQHAGAAVGAGLSRSTRSCTSQWQYIDVAPPQEEGARRGATLETSHRGCAALRASRRTCRPRGAARAAHAVRSARRAEADMTAYIIRRLWQMIPTMLGVDPARVLPVQLGRRRPRLRARRQDLATRSRSTTSAASSASTSRTGSSCGSSSSRCSPPTSARRGAPTRRSRSILATRARARR